MLFYSNNPCYYKNNNWYIKQLRFEVYHLVSKDALSTLPFYNVGNFETSNLHVLGVRNLIEPCLSEGFTFIVIILQIKFNTSFPCYITTTSYIINETGFMFENHPYRWEWHDSRIFPEFFQQNMISCTWLEWVPFHPYMTENFSHIASTFKLCLFGEIA